MRLSGIYRQGGVSVRFAQAHDTPLACRLMERCERSDPGGSGTSTDEHSAIACMHAQIEQGPEQRAAGRLCVRAAGTSQAAGRGERQRRRGGEGGRRGHSLTKKTTTERDPGRAAPLEYCIGAPTRLGSTGEHTAATQWWGCTWAGGGPQRQGGADAARQESSEDAAFDATRAHLGTETVSSGAAISGKSTVIRGDSTSSMWTIACSLHWM